MFQVNRTKNDTGKRHLTLSNQAAMSEVHVKRLTKPFAQTWQVNRK